MLGRLVDERQRRRDVATVWGDLLDRLRGLDGLLINLECSLSRRGEPWTETYRPFHFRADPEWAVPALEAAGVDACALANNHLLDFGPVALTDTIDHLDDVGIAHAGVGRTLDAALEPAWFTVDGLEVAVVAFTDNTSEYAADDDAAGVAHVEFDVGDDQSLDRVTESLSRARGADPDLLVASLHWGPNMVEAPPESFQAFARWLVDEGVDLVHGHSAHVFQGIEVVDGVPVLYDTGDFVDDYAVDDRLRNDRSFLFELDVTEGGSPTALRLVPTAIADCQVNAATGEAAAWSRERMREISAPFGTAFERDGAALVLSL